METDEGNKILKGWLSKGRKCVILWCRDHFCGYVETKTPVSYSTGIFGEYTCSPCSLIDAHGGLTFGADTLSTTPFEKNIKYFGMDFAHSGDWCKGMHASFNERAHKWTIEEVEKETEKMLDSILKFEKIYPKFKTLADKQKLERDKLLKKLGVKE